MVLRREHTGDLEGIEGLLFAWRERL